MTTEEPRDDDANPRGQTDDSREFAPNPEANVPWATDDAGRPTIPTATAATIGLSVLAAVAWSLVAGTAFAIGAYALVAILGIAINPLALWFMSCTAVGIDAILGVIHKIREGGDREVVP